MAKNPTSKATNVKTPLKDFEPIRPSTHQRTVSGVPADFQKPKTAMAKPGKLPKAPTMPGC